MDSFYRDKTSPASEINDFNDLRDDLCGGTENQWEDQSNFGVPPYVEVDTFDPGLSFSGPLSQSDLA